MRIITSSKHVGAGLRARPLIIFFSKETKLELLNTELGDRQSFDHSRAEGWAALVEAIFDADFSVVNAHPVKAEMSVAAPKTQAKEPIQLDVILVGKKKLYDTRTPMDTVTGFDEVVDWATRKLKRLSSVGIKLSKNDRRITLISQFISAIGPVSSAGEAARLLQIFQEELEKLVESLTFR